ncbi:hypothetical protein OK074_4708 [Actinobacteria bacterium OK074]|nr:hypothetical protein OK074_4708 [Actinobacteria bacterium OK074]
MADIIALLATLTGVLVMLGARRGRPHPVPDPPSIVTAPVRQPDPYVLPLPPPRRARERRWFKHARAAGRPVLRPSEEACWAPTRPSEHTDRPSPRPREPDWDTSDDLVRPYVREAMGEEWRTWGWESRHE